MAETASRSLKFVFFMLGVALPLAAFVLWEKSGGFRFRDRKAHIDELQDQTVEDSFPASDPPSAW